MAVSAGKALVGIEFNPADLAKLQATARTAGQKASSNFGTSLARGARVARTALLGIGLAAGVAVKQAGDFQQELNVLQSVSGATAAQMKALSAEALRLGQDAKLPATSAQDAAQALTELTKAGLSVKDAMAAARPVLQLSAAAQIDNATAANITATALNSFGLKGTDAGHVADVLAGAANASAGSITDMADAVQYAGASAKGAGQSLDDTAVAIGLMSNAGLSGSVAGSSFAQALRSLQNPSAKAQVELKKLGINVYDAAGNMKPMPALVKEFSSKLKGLTQQQKNQALATIFGSRAIQAARIVLDGGTKAWDKQAAAQKKAADVQRLAEAQTKGFNGALNAFVSNLQTLAIQLGTTLLPAVTSVVRAFSGFAGVMGRNQTATLAIVGAIAAVAAVIYTMSLAYRAALAVQKAWIVAQGIATAAQWAFNVALTANPIGIVIVALAALTVAIIVAYKKSETFRAIVHAAMHAAGVAVQFVIDHWKLLLVAIGPVGVAVLLVATHFQTVKRIGVIAGNAIKTAWDGVAGFVRAAIAPILEVANALQSVADKAGAVKSALGSVKDAGGGIVHTLSGGIVGATGGVVTRPTVATIGEAGPEAVIPLNQSPGNFPLAKLLNGGGGGGDIHLAVYIDGKAVDDAVVKRLDGVSRMVRSGTLRP